MRVAFAVAAGFLLVGAAYAQPVTGAANGAVAPSVAEPTLGQSTQAPTSPTETAPPANASQAPDTNHQIICHTTENTGSRLARHANRVCKTREQWEIESHDNERMLRQMGTVQGTRG